MKTFRRITIILISALIISVLLIVLFADTLLKSAVEEAGAAITGAKVEVSDANFSWSPFGIKLNGVQVTNPDKPMQNMIELGSIQTNVHFLPLLATQVIIDDLSATGVKFNTARRESGAITKPEKIEAESTDSIDMGALKEKLPTFDEILAKEPLLTPQRAKAFKQGVNEVNAALENEIKQLPDESKIKEYENNVKAIINRDLKTLEDVKKSKAELETIKDALGREKQLLENTRNSIKDTQSVLKQDYEQLRTAPKKDMQNLRDRYQFDLSGASNVTALLFGEEAQVWFDTLKTWIVRLQEVLPSSADEGEKPVGESTGGLFDFAYDNQYPDFLIRHARFDALLPLGNIDIKVMDITHQPQKLGRPILLDASANQLPKAKSFKFNAIINHVNPKAAVDKLDWAIEQWKLENINIAKRNSMPVTIQQSIAKSDGQLQIVNGQLNGQFKADFDNVRWQMGETQGWQKQITQTLAEINKFKIQGELSGSIAKPGFSISSDLDKQIQASATKQLKAQQDKLEKQLQSYLDQQILDAAGPYQTLVTRWKTLEGNNQQKLAQIEDLLKSEVKNIAQEKKQQLEKKAEEQIKNKLKGLNF